MLSLCIFLPLHSQEISDTGEEEFSDEDLLFIESEGLTVVGSTETTQQMKALNREDIEKFHAPDLASLLQPALDMSITRYGPYGNQTDISMRGFDSERIAFLIDGVPANSPMSGEFDISVIDLNAVERIEVIYGGSDSKYNVSGALGGVINIITVKEQKAGLRIGTSLSNTAALPGKYYDRASGEDKDPEWKDLFDAQNAAASVGYGTEKFSVTANGFFNRADNHFLYQDDYGKTLRKEKNEIRDMGASASIVAHVQDYTKLIAGGDVYYGDKNVPTSGTSWIAGRQLDFSTRQNIILDMPRFFRDDLAAEASLSHILQTMDYGPPGGKISRHKQRSLMAVNRWTWYGFEKLMFRFGGDYRYTNLDSTEVGGHDRHDGGMYLGAEYRPLKKILIIPSLKTVFSGTAAEPVVPVPKLGFLWLASDSLSFKNNYFRSFKNPDLEDLYWSGGGAAGNPDLKPEDGWGTDLGLSWQPVEWAGLESTVFTQWTRDSIHWYGSSDGNWKPQNVGEAVFFGWDSRLRFVIPFSPGPVEKPVLSLSYQFLNSYLLSYGYTWDSGKRIPYMPMHTIGASLDIPWKTGSLFISGHYETLRFADTGNITKLDPYFLMNITVNQKLGGSFTVFAAGRNILNTSYESFDGYPMPGFTLTLGLKMNFDIPTEKADE
jgi:vitamin B12 transporter